MSKILRTNFDRHERRRDRRYVSPGITVTMRGTEYAVENWSLGGFLAPGCRHAPGAPVAGEVRIGGKPGAYPFTAHAVREDGQGAGYCFTARSGLLVGALDQALSRRLSGRRP